jgi:DNA polymerase-3 subunit beta
MTTVGLPKPVTASSSDTASLRLKCKQEDLARGLSIVSGAVLPHSTVPILKNIQVSTDRGRLRLSATTLEIGIQVWIDAQIEHGEGTTALPADLFKKMVATLPLGAVTLQIPQGSQTMNVTCPGTNANIRGVDPREFPVIPGIEGECDAAVIDAGLLRTMINQVVFAAERDMMSKPVWSSVKLVIEDRTVTLAAADSFRVAERIAPLPTESPTSLADILIPARNLARLADILPSQGPVQVLVTPQKNQVVFHLAQGEQIDFVSRLIEGVFPPYKRIIPREHATRAVVDTRQLATTVARAALFAVDLRKSVRVIFKPQESGTLFATLTIEADDADLGSNVSTLSAEISGPRQEVFFPVERLAEALAHIDTPQVAIEITTTGRPVVIKPVSDIEYTSLVQTMVSSQTTA